MKIGFIAKEYPPYGNPRTSTAIVYPRLAKSFVQQGHSVHVITQSQDGQKRQHDNDDQVTIHEVGPAPKTGSALRRLRFGFNAAREAKKLLKDGTIEIVNASLFGAEPFFGAFLRLSPFVIETYHFSEYMSETKSYKTFFEGMQWRFSGGLEGYSLKRADLVIANSPESYNFLLTKKKIPKERITLILEAMIDFTRFKKVPSNLKSEIGAPENSNIVLYVGYLKPAKGMDYLLESIRGVTREFPSTVFVLKGEDTNSGPGGMSFRKYIEDHAAKNNLKDHIKFMDRYLPVEELASLYSGCDLFVFPSLAETFGWPPVEAMACERPVVATTIGIIPQIKAEGLIAVPPGDANALTAGMRSFLSMDKSKRKSLGEQNRRAVEGRFSFDEMVSKYYDAFSSVLAEKKKS